MFGKSNVFILTTTGWAAFWAIFSQNHLVTLLDSSMNANFQVGAANSAPKMKCQISSRGSRFGAKNEMSNFKQVEFH
jgi:hypothetical protein